MDFNLNALKEKCSCGREHPIYVENIILEGGCINRLTSILKHSSLAGCTTPAIVCDTNTYKACGERVAELLPQAVVLCLPADNLHADEHGVSLLEQAIHMTGKQFDLLLAVGSGTIHDLTRYVSYERKLPFVSVPTAASVDGFVSTVAAMTWYGFKKSLIAASPVLVIADSEIFSQAPYRLTASGISDLLGKYTALLDWRIAHLITGEPICSRICELEEQALSQLTACLPGIQAGHSEAYEQLMYALLLSGIAMQMMGNSRPASGAEHHFSHLWEMHVINPPIDAYHGEKVGVGLLNCCSIYYNLADAIENNRIRVRQSSGIETDLLYRYLPEAIAADMINENTPYMLDTIDSVKLEQQLPKIAELIHTIPEPEEIHRLLQAAKAPAFMEDIGLSSDLTGISAQLAPYVRNRLTLLKLTKLFEIDKTGNII